MSNKSIKDEFFDENEVKFDKFVSIYFRISLFISATLMMIGLVLYYYYNNSTIDPTMLNGSIIFQEVTDFTPLGIMLLGIVILLLIPVGRVVILIVHHLSEKDYPLTVISLIVLTFIFIGIIFDIK